MGQVDMAPSPEGLCCLSVEVFLLSRPGRPHRNLKLVLSEQALELTAAGGECLCKADLLAVTYHEFLWLKLVFVWPVLQFLWLTLF